MFFSRRKYSDALAEELISAAQDGDKDAFGEIYDRFIEKIYRFIYFKVGTREIVEDLTQTVFLKALEKLKYFKGDGSFQSWLFAISRNTVIDYYRTKRQFTNLDKIAETHADTKNIDFEIKESLDEVFEKLNHLEDVEQEVIILHSIEQYSFAEIAEITGKSEESLRVIKHRGLKKLKSATDYGK